MTPENPFAAAVRRRDGAEEARDGEPQRQAMAPIAAPAQLDAHVESIKLFGEWGIANVWGPDITAVTVVGNLVKDLKEGLDYSFSGRVTTHAKYGKRFEAVSATPIIKPNPRAVIKFIAANFDGIGERSAAKLVEAAIKEGGPSALEALRQQLLTQPWSVDFEPIGRKGVYSSEQKDATVAAFVHRNLATRLGSLNGMRDSVLKALSGYLARQLAAAGGVGGMQRDDQNPVLAQPARGDAPATRVQGASAGLTALADPIDPVAASWAMLSRDPYAPIERVPGYGFVVADAIGRMVNMPIDAPQRLAALVAHALREHCERGGHVFLTRNQLDQSIAKLDHRVDSDLAISQGVADKTIIVDGDAEDPGRNEMFDGVSELSPGAPRYYRPALLRAEVELARRVARMLDPAQTLVAGALLDDKSASAPLVRGRIRAAARQVFKSGLDPSQEEALRRIVSSPVRLHTLTAGPGCGKTALMEVLVEMLPDKRFHFCAPTGKAAKVLSSRLAAKGYSAATIHSTLKGAGPGEFEVDAGSPLTGDILVVDESSMPDLCTAEAVFAAANDEMHIILLGDYRQLPSIQPGRVLMDLLQVAGIDHNELTVVHRNSGGILDVVNEIGEGRLNPVNRESVTFSNTLGDAAEEFHAVMGMYLHAVAQRGIENVILMMPRRQGKVDKPGWNTTYANAILRNVCNPNAAKVTGTAFQVNDRIVIRANMTIEQPDPAELAPTGRAARRGKEQVEAAAGHERPSARVVNGDTGTIKSFVLDPKDPKNASAKWIAIDLDDGRRIQYPGAAAGDLGLAYAMTVHAGQGSQYQEVICVITPGSPSFMNRNMFFTGASRAQQCLRIFGEDRVLAKVAQTPLPERNSALVDRIRHEIDSDEDTPAQAPEARDRRNS